VASGMRRCCIMVIRPGDVAARAQQWARQGLSVLPLYVRRDDPGYADAAKKPQAGKPFAFEVALALPRHLAEFKEAWDMRDDDQIGRLLGYSPCCCAFFRRVWVERGLIDTTWPMAVGAGLQEGASTEIAVTGPPQGNILWRWLGARAVPHLPCRFDCRPTAELGEKLVQFGREAGYAEEMDWLMEILSWPVEWSALHGIAEVTTPIVRMVVRTDASARRHIVRWKGNNYPARSWMGHPAVLRPRLEHTKQARIPRSDWYHTDNGFSNSEAMARLHEPIVSLALKALAGRRGHVLDLGCGNGALLEKICAANDGLIPFGIEINGERLVHAHELLPQFSENFVLGDFFDLNRWDSGTRYALAILMIGRLLEVPRERADELVTTLKKCCDQVLVYVYPDWTLEGFETLVERAGLRLQEHAGERTGLLALELA